MLVCMPDRTDRRPTTERTHVLIACGRRCRRAVTLARASFAVDAGYSGFKSAAMVSCREQPGQQRPRRRSLFIFIYLTPEQR
ncbi:hypothetical protein L596_010877 [Steinernema carpocapsae]|uniref:Uncharacterized protein n=1 Tax=Steinernema carpocapsae TaxID=34508 RepID=A0A4U5PJN1_STECR|nr:hypothetical protein L596_010877 [Steinernema carpocapsae]